jgi:hypothetical protein
VAAAGHKFHELLSDCEGAFFTVYVIYKGSAKLFTFLISVYSLTGNCSNMQNYAPR